MRPPLGPLQRFSRVKLTVMNLAIERILELAVTRSASEVWLVPGRPLLARIDGGMREAREDVPLVGLADVWAVVDLQTGGRELLDARGVVEFPLRFGDDYARFDVTVMDVTSTYLAVIRPAVPAVAA